MWVQFLIVDLRFHMPHGVAKRQKNLKKKEKCILKLNDTKRLTVDKGIILCCWEWVKILTLSIGNLAKLQSQWPIHWGYTSANLTKVHALLELLFYWRKTNNKHNKSILRCDECYARREQIRLRQIGNERGTVAILIGSLGKTPI